MSPNFDSTPARGAAGASDDIPQLATIDRVPRMLQAREASSFAKSMPVSKPMLSSMNTKSSVTTLPDAPGA